MSKPPRVVRRNGIGQDAGYFARIDFATSFTKLFTLALMGIARGAILALFVRSCDPRKLTALHLTPILDILPKEKPSWKIPSY